MPDVTVTTDALPPADFTSRGNQPSKPSPLTNTSFASATFFASAGVGAYTCASLSGPTSTATLTRSPPTLRTKSPRIEKLATTLSRSCACAGALTAINPRQTSQHSRNISRLKMPAWKQLPHQPADRTEQQRDHIEPRGDQDDRRSRGNFGLERQHQPGIARDDGASNRN